ncbi:hypothetical protein PPTG_24001 [Phytophthora nicotianae INRA-310]|uniref:Uncharacterized protein n=1 Tax=Phytophthora nicotianae (strain INRA-310) TaxID=761204 RepID=W2PLC7_PHYN3|nr:hypothetical protein PPTG_24001 [Phytophthora nicotianae INRA-310]ETN01788.1 hypothetical protein PPTG_24001 [Phytophthora nicotianae INRA-310]
MARLSPPTHSSTDFWRRQINFSFGWREYQLHPTQGGCSRATVILARQAPSSKLDQTCIVPPHPRSCCYAFPELPWELSYTTTLVSYPSPCSYTVTR